MGASECRNCGAPIIWAKSPSKRMVPADATPVPYGTMMPMDEGSWTYFIPDATVRYRQHFATCRANLKREEKKNQPIFRKMKRKDVLAERERTLYEAAMRGER